MTFSLRHLGMTLVDQPKGEELSAAAVKRIVATVRTAVWGKIQNYFWVWCVVIFAAELLNVKSVQSDNHLAEVSSHFV